MTYYHNKGKQITLCKVPARIKPTAILNIIRKNAVSLTLYKQWISILIHGNNALI